MNKREIVLRFKNASLLEKHSLVTEFGEYIASLRKGSNTYCLYIVAGTLVETISDSVDRIFSIEEVKGTERLEAYVNALIEPMSF